MRLFIGHLDLSRVLPSAGMWFEQIHASRMCLTFVSCCGCFHCSQGEHAACALLYSRVIRSLKPSAHMWQPDWSHMRRGNESSAHKDRQSTQAVPCSFRHVNSKLIFVFAFVFAANETGATVPILTGCGLGRSCGASDSRHSLCVTRPRQRVRPSASVSSSSLCVLFFRV